MLGEMRIAALLVKTSRTDSTAVTAPHAIRLATEGAAEASGICARVGTRTEGKRTDIVLVDRQESSLVSTAESPLSTFIPSLVYSASRSALDTGIVDSEILRKDGEFVDIDEAPDVADVQERAERVFAETADDWRTAGSALARRAENRYAIGPVGSGWTVLMGVLGALTPLAGTVIMFQST